MNKNICIYTDGACKGNPGKGGYAAIVLKIDKETLEEVIVKEIIRKHERNNK